MWLMRREKLIASLGDEVENTLDSLLAAPGAFGNILVGVASQVRLYDVAFLGLMVAGWAWVVAGYLINDNENSLLLALAVLPTLAWVVCGVIGGLIYEVGGVGWRSLAFWESYLLMLMFIAAGPVTLRLAVNPKDRRIYRGPPQSKAGA
jgi:hypothetical protein